MTEIGALPEGTVTDRPEKPALTSTELFSILRTERDLRLAATAYPAMPDYPPDDAARAA